MRRNKVDRHQIFGPIDLPVRWDRWQDAVDSGSLLVADPGPWRSVAPVLRPSSFHDEMRETVGPTDLSRKTRDSGPRLRNRVHYEPDPELVIRRVGQLAQVQDFDGHPYSGLMSVEDATRALREALQSEGG